MEKCCGQRDLARIRARVFAVRDRAPWVFPDATARAENPQADAAAVLTMLNRADYIGGSRCAVRLGVSVRPRSSSLIRASIRGPGVRFRSEAKELRSALRTSGSGTLRSRAV